MTPGTREEEKVVGPNPTVSIVTNKKPNRNKEITMRKPIAVLAPIVAAVGLYFFYRYKLGEFNLSGEEAVIAFMIGGALELTVVLICICLFVSEPKQKN